MIQFDLQEHCSGCSACANVCPVAAIHMQPNQSGFLFPAIDPNTCIHCRKCDAVCPHLNARASRLETDAVKGSWLYASADEEAKKKSASGAASYELARYVIGKGGVVVGCAWSEALTAEHIVTHTEEELVRIQGSKYVQSATGSVYKLALQEMKHGKTVLFTGTPCQVNAMHQIVMNEKGQALRERLITSAVICHGVAAPKAWETFKKWLEQHEGSSLTDVNFRDKTKAGYKLSHCRYSFASGRSIYLPTYLPSYLPSYIEATLVYNLATRKSCGNCDCKGITEACDLILGDWYAECEGEGRMGTSCIVACTERGSDLAQQALQNLRPLDVRRIIADNFLMMKSTPLSDQRERFLSSLDVSIWNHPEDFYPSKYLLKKILVKTGLYTWIKRKRSISRSAKNENRVSS